MKSAAIAGLFKQVKVLKFLKIIAFNRMETLQRAEWAKARWF